MLNLWRYLDCVMIRDIFAVYKNRVKRIYVVCILCFDSPLD